MAAFTLGSASPRRAELLAQLGLEFDIRSADIDETPADGEQAQLYVQRMARQKGEALLEVCSGVLLTADTIVVLDGEILGKPRDPRDAKQMLETLSARSHDVYTAVSIENDGHRQDALVHTRVSFMALDSALIDSYLATAEPWDKAGAYGIQGVAGSFVERIEGSITNVIGLPLVETRSLLIGAGLDPGLAAP